MKVIAATRDFKDVWESEDLKRLEDYVGLPYAGWEQGVDDSYVVVRTSRDVNADIEDFISDNLPQLWPALTEGVEFTSLNDFVEQVTQLYRDEFDEDLELD